MGRQQKTVTIEGWKYELAQLGAVEGRELVVLFGRVLGRFAPLIVAAMKSRKAKVDTEAKAIDIAQELGEVMQTLQPKELEPLWDAFSRNAQVWSKDGKSREPVADVFDDHFAGEYFRMVQFFIEAAKLNFGDFLSRVLAQASALDAEDGTPSA
jgi:hypothetical protein